MKRLFGAVGGRWRLLAVGLTVTLVAGGTAAVAADLITSADIKNNGVKSKDIKNNTIKLADLSKAVKQKLDEAAQGGPGATGAQGPKGDQGPPGQASPAQYQGPQWGVIDRNTLGSPVAALRPGPFVGAQAPPFGDGSLGLTVNGVPRVATSGEAEQATFGNEVDFTGDLVSSITELGFHVYTTGENNSRGNPNMPVIKFEIDPNLEPPNDGISFSTLSFTPANSAANQWSGYIDAITAAASPSGLGFVMSGAAGAATGCVLATPCTFAQVQTALADGGDPAVIGTAAVGKGRDLTWSGAVDGLRINDTVYDFEPFGVSATPAP